jgi:hypothetical protein
VWYFNADGKVDRVINLSGDRHQMDAYVWNGYTAHRSRAARLNRRSRSRPRKGVMR